MANIFTPFRKADDKLIAKLTAIFQSVTKKNLAIPFGKSTKQIFDENYRSLLKAERAELDEKFREAIRNRFVFYDTDDEELSNSVALKAALMVYAGNKTVFETIHEEAHDKNILATTNRMVDAVAESPSAKTQIKISELKFKDIFSIDADLLARCLCIARELNGRAFTPTEHELAEWTEYRAAFSQKLAEWKAFCKQLLPKKNQIMSADELEQNLDALQKKSDELTNSVRQTLSDEFQRRKDFSERAEVEHGELLERLKLTRAFQFYDYREKVEQHNAALSDKQKHES